MRIERSREYPFPHPHRSFQRWYSENEDWKSHTDNLHRLSYLFQRWYSENEDWKRSPSIPLLLWNHVSKVILRKWGLKGNLSSTSLEKRSTFQRWYSENEDWKHKPLSSFFFFKAEFQRWYSENEDWKDERGHAAYITMFVSKVILRKWGLKVTINIKRDTRTIPFQRWYSENEDWKFPSISATFCRYPGFKGDTQKMRIERVKVVHYCKVRSRFKGDTQKMRIERIFTAFHTPM